ncbi:hypothetical protein Val02_33890 [Virgisporangium aliadipatigenens]|uniref:Uncharacterized protein n=1 Tax=Virgisporangium aliadipatigenens TaxID=741659 RepID=A0A8J3YLV6_9ACTN|nr:hypothetical protein [Virgisporangium aliadipatigenens]GIJ46503.1 hypothetical protein Val02_33890 [Virgisporangium aliadipatigenens]
MPSANLSTVDIDLDARAGDVLTADIVATKAQQRWAVVRLFASSLICALLDMGGSRPQPVIQAANLIVTRLDTGEEVWRTPAHIADLELKTHVQRQLDELTVAEFYDAWGIIDPEAAA